MGKKTLSALFHKGVCRGFLIGTNLVEKIEAL
jgi:hypothetical protein